MVPSVRKLSKYDFALKVAIIIVYLQHIFGSHIASHIIYIIGDMGGGRTGSDKVS